MFQFTPLIRFGWRLPLLTALGAALGFTSYGQTVDGTRDASYPAALAVQTIETQFGDNTNNSVDFAYGSELDNIHARIVGQNLYLFIGGNLENGNRVDLFFDSQPGGQNQLSGNSNYLTNFNGLKFDAGFTADYAMSVTCNYNPLQVFSNYTAVPGVGADYTGGGTGRTQAVHFGDVTMGVADGTISINNSNMAGVAGGTAAANMAAATAVATGLEYKIPLSALGTSQYGGAIRIAAMINNGGWSYLANQTLGGLPAGTANLGGDGAGNYTGTLSGVDFTSFGGNQYVTVPNAAPTVDGVLDGTYQPALAVQTVNTHFGDNTLMSQGDATGSELDNIHADVYGSDLYVFIGGNLQNNFNRLTLFFDSKAGGQNTLTGNGGFVGNMNGLKFDPGFTADYALSLGCNNSPVEVYTNYSALPGTNTDYTGGGVGRTQTINFNAVVAGAGTGTVAVDNSNAAGVDDGPGGGGTGAANQPAADAVGTGMEYRIPLSALGAVQGGGDIKITAFISNGGWNYLSNQVLAGVPAGTDNLAGPSSVDFSGIAGNQFVTVTNGGGQTQPAIAVAQQALSFYNVSTTAGSVTRTVTIANNGDAPLNVTNITSSNAAFTPSATTLTVAPGFSQNITITYNPSVAGLITATITISSNDPNNPTETITASGTGIPPGQVIVDGTLDAALYGPARAVQTTPTAFGNSSSGQPGTANGSELDAAYAYVSGGYLYLTLTGNLQNNNNKLLLFLDTNINGGQQTYSAANDVVEFNTSANLAGLQFDTGFKPEYMLSINQGGPNVYANFVPMNGSGTGALYLTPAINDLTSPLDFGNGVLGEVAINNANTAGVDGTLVNNPGAVTTGVEVKIPLAAIGNPVGSMPIRVLALIAGNDYSFLSNQALGGLPGGTANLGGPGGTNLATPAGVQFFTARRGDVTVSAANTQLSGDFNTVTVTGTGELFPSETRFDAATAIVVQSGGSLTVGAGGTRNLTGTGAFTTQAGSTLHIGNAAGIAAAGATGAVQLTGTRALSTDATYLFEVAAGGAISTGSGMPTTVRNLELHTGASPATLTLTNPLSVRRLLRLENNTLLTTSSQLTLLSSPGDGQAMLLNEGTSTVTGTATVQSYPITTFNHSLGYRHFASPVANAPVSVLGPTTTTPFAYIYRYDEPLVSAMLPATVPAGTTPFDLGWTPATTGNLMPGAGYTVLQSTPYLVSFTGPLNLGTVTAGVSNTALLPGNTGSGWNFLGNPYPSPLDADLLMASFPAGVDQAISTWKSLPITIGNQTNGQYITRVPGVGSTDVGGGTSQYLPVAQAFFVHASGAATVTMTSAMRPTTYVNALHYRTAVDQRPRLTLGVTAQAGLPVTDNLVVVFDENATLGFDNGFDGRKLRNVGEVPSLAALQQGEELAINALPALTSRTVVPLAITVSTAGTYTLAASELLNLPAGTRVYLRDALTGAQQDLTQNALYACTLDAGTQAQRFALVFEPAASPLATAAELATAGVTISPNPAHGAFRLTLPATLTATAATLVDALGRTVAQPSLTGATTEVRLPVLPAGVYTLRLQTSAGAVTRRVVLE